MNNDSLCIINIAHEEDGDFVSGTLSTLEGAPKATWTFRQDGGEFTVDNDVESDDFDAIWSELNEPVFVRHAVTSRDTQLDFRQNYVVGIIFNIRGETGRLTFLVPADEDDPVWVRWLKNVEATQRQA